MEIPELEFKNSMHGRAELGDLTWEASVESELTNLLPELVLFNIFILFLFYVLRVCESFCH